jgi:hypothetical protein
MEEAEEVARVCIGQDGVDRLRREGLGRYTLTQMIQGLLCAVVSVWSSGPPHTQFKSLSQGLSSTGL